MKFYSSYNRPPSVFHEPCPTEVQDYIKDSTTGELVPCGKIPFYERIQSYHDSVNLSAKLKRFAMGDSSALGSLGGSFGDFTAMPSDLREVLDSRQKVVQGFEALSPDIRGIFNDSFEEFEKAVTNGTAERRIYEYQQSISSGGAIDPGAGSPVNPGGNE